MAENTNEDHLYAFWTAARIIRDGDQDDTIIAYVIDLARTDFWPRLADRATAHLKQHGIEVMPVFEEETDLTYAASAAAKGPEERAQAYWEAAQRERRRGDVGGAGIHA